MHARRLPFTILAVVLFSAVPLSAHAAVVNGSFETASFLGWNTIGDTSIQSFPLGIAATDGQFMALLTTLCDLLHAPHPLACDTGGGVREIPYSANNAAQSSLVLEGFFGYSQSEINDIRAQNSGRPFPAGEGSGISQTISGNAGDILSFDFYYVTDEGTLNADQAYFTLVPNGPGSKTFAYLNPLTGSGSPSPVALCDHLLPRSFACNFPGVNRTTDWQHAMFALPSTGAFTFGFGLYEIFEGTVPSALVIDNVRLTAVPQPSTFALLCAGMILLLIGRRVTSWHRP